MIKEIIEEHNETFPKIKPIEEIMNINVPDIKVDGIPSRNGGIWAVTGSGGSGKSSLILNFFKNKNLYKNKFHNIWLICPESSYSSVKDHPFEDHDKVMHELTADLLYEIYDNLMDIKLEQNKKKKKPKYSLVFIDDFADKLKDITILKALNKLLIKARHINCCFIFSLQSYYYFPKILRKQITYVTLFKSKNIEEFITISHELMNMNKDDALKLFNFVFDEPYNHLDIDTVNNNYYKNFNHLKIISKYDI
jgi:GTPase SAR1 family protein